MGRRGIRTGRATTLWPPTPPAVTRHLPGGKLETYALYYDTFDETLTAGNVDGTDTTDENALRDVYDPSNDLHLDNKLIMDQYPGDQPAIWFTTLASGAWEVRDGYAFFLKMKCTLNGNMKAGFDEDLTAGLLSEPGIITGYYWGEGSYVFDMGDSGTFVFPVDTVISFLVVRRYDSAGHFYFYRLEDGPWQLYFVDGREPLGN